jgi:hypothetical protein
MRSIARHLRSASPPAARQRSSSATTSILFKAIQSLPSRICFINKAIRRNNNNPSVSHLTLLPQR